MAEAVDRVAVKVAVPFSAPVVTSLIDRLGAASSSVIVRLPVASVILALVALESVRVAVSLASSRASARMGTVKVLEVSPAAKVKVPLAAV